VGDGSTPISATLASTSPTTASTSPTSRRAATCSATSSSASRRRPISPPSRSTSSISMSRAVMVDGKKAALHTADRSLNCTSRRRNRSAIGLTTSTSLVNLLDHAGHQGARQATDAGWFPTDTGAYTVDEPDGTRMWNAEQRPPVPTRRRSTSPCTSPRASPAVGQLAR